MMTNRTRMWAGIWLVACMAAGCAPVIENLTVFSGTQGEPVDVTASIRPWLTSYQSPQMHVGPYPPPHGPYDDAGAMTDLGAHQFEGTLDGLAYGGHELELRVTFQQVLLPFGQSTRTARRTFLVGAPPECFAFDDPGAALDGWTGSAIFDGDSSTVVTRPTCPLETVPTFWLTRSWPDPPNQHTPGRGSLTAIITATCFPLASGDVPGSGLWRFDLISPDLEGGAPGWQGLGGVSFRVYNNVPVWYQPIVTVRLADGSESSFAPADSAGNPVFYDVAASSPPEWEVIEAPISLPDGATVLRIRIRVFGVPEQTVFGGEAFVRVDGVCAISGP